jgi:hypothetical protein
MVRQRLDEELMEQQHVRPELVVNERLGLGMSERISSNDVGG